MAPSFVGCETRGLFNESDMSGDEMKKIIFVLVASLGLCAVAEARKKKDCYVKSGMACTAGKLTKNGCEYGEPKTAVVTSVFFYDSKCEQVGKVAEGTSDAQKPVQDSAEGHRRIGISNQTTKPYLGGPAGIGPGPHKGPMEKPLDSTQGQ